MRLRIDLDFILFKGMVVPNLTFYEILAKQGLKDIIQISQFVEPAFSLRQKRMRTTLHGFYFWLENVLGGSVRDQKRASISGWFESTWRDRVLIISK